MHSLSDQSESLYPTWRHPNGGVRYFDNDRAQEWIESYNRTQDPDSLAALLRHVEPLARSLLAYRNTIAYAPLDELLSRVRLKIWRSLKLYDPSRGTAFSFCSMVISRVGMSAVNESWSRQGRFLALEEADRCAVPAETYANEAIAEIEHLVRQVKTSCTKRYELEAQRWFIESFIDSGFRLRRHQASDGVMQVFNLDHSRSRQLFDLTMVAVRRELLPNRRLRLLGPLDLRGTKSEALMRYAKYLSSEEFTRLAVLLRDVAPSVVLTVNPCTACAVRKGEPQATRSNLLLVLHGAETDRLLFTDPLPSRPARVPDAV
jgi:hypothetical protein